LVWHATEGAYAGAVEWLCTRTVYNAAGEVLSGPDASAHAVVREDGGEVSQLVTLHDKAWHAEAWNRFTVGVEHASETNGFASTAQLKESARRFGWLCMHLRIPPVHGLHKPRGIVRHRDLGVAGGNHHDGPSDQVWFNVFLPAVQAELARGGFRPEYLR
jgi:N-acetyl-anhydromuramyl-L-alanine amidase AmpD